MLKDTAAGRPADWEHSGEPWGRIDILSAEVRTADPSLRLTRLERTILMYLAVKRGGNREEIADRLFPHLDLDSANNTMKVAICRARRKCGSPWIVNYRDGRYELSESPLDELRAIENRVRLAQQLKRLLTDQESSFFRQCSNRLQSRAPQPWENELWFEPIEWQLGHIKREICRLLANDALLKGDAADALHLAAAYDDGMTLDEEPTEIAIRAYQALGNRRGALEEFARLERVLDRELGTKPSERLRTLILNGETR